MLGVRFHPLDVQTLTRGAMPSYLEQFRSEVGRDHLAASCRGRQARVTGSGRDIEDAGTGCDAGGVDEIRLFVIKRGS
jgi:hypothetical protein